MQYFPKAISSTCSSYWIYRWVGNFDVRTLVYLSMYTINLYITFAMIVLYLDLQLNTKQKLLSLSSSISEPAKLKFRCFPAMKQWHLLAWTKLSSQWRLTPAAMRQGAERTQTSSAQCRCLTSSFLKSWNPTLHSCARVSGKSFRDPMLQPRGEGKTRRLQDKSGIPSKAFGRRW